LPRTKRSISAPLDKLTILLADPDEEVRENAAWSMGELAGVGVGSMGAIEPLNGALEDANVRVRGMAAWALGRLAEKMEIALPSPYQSFKNCFPTRACSSGKERNSRL
jgi:hypothetical protein